MCLCVKKKAASELNYLWPRNANFAAKRDS